MEPEEPQGIAVEPEQRQWIGTIEFVAVIVVVLAIIALAVWFVFFAHNPLLH